jgi:hypothetical protein
VPGVVPDVGVVPGGMTGRVPDGMTGIAPGDATGGELGAGGAAAPGVTTVPAVADVAGAVAGA